MSRKSKRELVDAVRERYAKADRAGKGRILDELVATTGYHRKYAIRVLRKGERRAGIRRKAGRRAVYRGAVVEALRQIWEIYGRICSKRLHPYLPEAVKVLERCGEMRVEEGTKQLLLRMSRASIDRCLSVARVPGVHGLSTTKPGTLLRKSIPVKIYTKWDDQRPGFLEVDLVAHCGESAEGPYLNTLTCTDICTGWTELVALPNRSQKAVHGGIREMRPLLPFALLGLDSDNGAEFINTLLYEYCLAEHITFTRCRPYRKNDQAHVEQKNWSVVRHTVGYDRLDSPQELALLEGIYRDLRLYINFFQPVLKLTGKEHLGERIVRQYDQARTPFQRVLERQEVPVADKARLLNLYLHLNPVSLRRSIDDQVARLWKIAR